MLRRLATRPPGDASGGPLKVVVAPIRALLQPIVAGLGDLVPVRLAAGDDADPEDVITRLVDIGYARVEMVSKRGELAVRGGLLDVFPPTEEHPLRVEFFGDTVEEIRVFKVADQRSAGPASTACGPRPAGNCCSPRRSGPAPRNSRPSTRASPRSSARSPTGSPSRAWRRSPRSSPTGWTCCSTTCRSAPSCSPATPSGSGPGRSSWSRPARSSSRRPGQAPPPAARRRSTSADRPSSRSSGSARRRPSSASPGGPSRRSVSPTRRRAATGGPAGRGTGGRG